MLARLVALLPLFALIAGAASAIPPQTRIELNALFAEQVTEDAPGLALGIVRNGEVVFEAYGGLAELNHGAPVTAGTRFNIASNAKQYTALAVLELVEAGQIDLRADIRTYLPDALPDIDAPITVAQLIAHESGIRDVYALWGLRGETWWRNFFGNRDAMTLINAQSDLNFTPGSARIYSNSNYILLTEIIAAVSGQSFAEYAADLFDRLGMGNTRFKARTYEIIPELARPYGNFGSWAEYPSITRVHGDGALYTTLGDQLRFEALLQREDRTALLDQSQGPVPGAASVDAGFGLERGGRADLPTLHHEGSTGAYNAFLLRVPGEALAVIAMSNNATLSPRSLAVQAATRILGEDRFDGAIFREAPSQDAPAVPLADLVGAYLEPDGNTVIRIRQSEDGLQREIEGRDPVRLIAVSANVFEYETVPGLYAAFENETGRWRMALIYPYQAPSLYERVPDTQGDPDAIRFEGEFVNDETGASLTLRPGEDGPVMVLNGNERVLEPLTATRFFADGYGLDLDLSPDGAIEGLQLSLDRAHRIRFARR